MILNPQIEDYKRLLTTDQIDIAKKNIIKRMKKYPMFIKKNKEERPKEEKSSRSERYEAFKVENTNQPKEEELITPIDSLLTHRNLSINDIKAYWLSKLGTEDQQLAYVALEILGLLITSVQTERSFSKSRYIINHLRTNISPDHARDQMIIKCNRNVAKEILDSIDFFKNILNE